MIENTMEDLYRVCVKLYAPEPEGIDDDAEAFVPIFHEWIRDEMLDLVAIDVADYAHVPDSPGIMLVAHEASFALDRSDGRFGLFAQRRTPLDGDTAQAVVTTLRQALRVAELLEADARLNGMVRFDRSTIRVESNDRLRAPNTDEGYGAFEPHVLRAIRTVFPDGEAATSRIRNDPRDRLAIEVRVESARKASDRAA